MYALESLPKERLEDAFEHPNQYIPSWPSVFHAVERENVGEAAVRLLEQQGYTADNSPAIAWKRRPEETMAAYCKAVLGEDYEEEEYD